MSTTSRLYLAISAAITIWVARTLHDRGRTFLVNCATGNEKLADSTLALSLLGTGKLLALTGETAYTQTLSFRALPFHSTLAIREDDAATNHAPLGVTP